MENKKLSIIIFFVAIALSCVQPRHTTYVQDLVRGYNGRWYAIGQKRVCGDSCKITLVNDTKNFKGDTLRLYSVRY